MARIAGVELPPQKKIKIALTYIYGIGHSLAKEILEKTGIDPEIKTKDLTEEQINALRNFISQNCKIEGDLRRQIQEDISHLKQVGCYRGIRHARNLPVRGQRTRTNARTRKGHRQRIGGKK